MGQAVAELVGLTLIAVRGRVEPARVLARQGSSPGRVSLTPVAWIVTLAPPARMARICLTPLRLGDQRDQEQLAPAADGQLVELDRRDGDVLALDGEVAPERYVVWVIHRFPRCSGSCRWSSASQARRTRLMSQGPSSLVLSFSVGEMVGDLLPGERSVLHPPSEDGPHDVAFLVVGNPDSLDLSLDGLFLPPKPVAGVSGVASDVSPSWPGRPSSARR